MKYTWNEAKELANQRKHAGISFAMAALVFEDTHCLVFPERVDQVTGEQRWHAIGAVQLEAGSAAILVVVHVYREDKDGEEIIRIVSARAAEKHEIRRYREQNMD